MLAIVLEHKRLNIKVLIRRRRSKIEMNVLKGLQDSVVKKYLEMFILSKNVTTQGNLHRLVGCVQARLQTHR